MGGFLNAHNPLYLPPVNTMRSSLVSRLSSLSLSHLSSLSLSVCVCVCVCVCVYLSVCLSVNLQCTRTQCKRAFNMHTHTHAYLIAAISKGCFLEAPIRPLFSSIAADVLERPGCVCVCVSIRTHTHDAHIQTNTITARQHKHKHKHNHACTHPPSDPTHPTTHSPVKKSEPWCPLSERVSKSFLTLNL